VAALGDPVAVVPMAELPGFTPPTAAGHGGEVLSLRIGDRRLLVFIGRIHAYEGHELRHVVHPVRAACAAGAQTVVLTNAAGGLRDDFAVGQPVLISDHLNLTARSPLEGAQFVDLVDAYSPRLRAIAHEIDPSLAEGVYAARARNGAANSSSSIRNTWAAMMNVTLDPVSAAVARTA
jgi:purine-nucleoside phosphorylase